MMDSRILSQATMSQATQTINGSPAVKCRPLNVHLLDWLERALVLGLYGWLVFRVVAVYATKASPLDLILLPSEGLVVWFILIRRTTSDVSRRPGDWLLAFGATAAPLLAHPGLGKALLPAAVCACLMLIGILVQIHAKLTLGRSFGCVPANRGLKLFGPYRFVRHPMYMGYLFTQVGFLLMNPTVWNLAVYGFCYVLLIPRLLAEERLLGRDSNYLEYMTVVRYRLIPGVF